MVFKRTTTGEGTGGNGLPDGGIENDALIKQSATDGDAGWEATATASNATPQPLGTAAPGSGTSFARDDHVHATPLGLLMGFGDGSDGNVVLDGTNTFSWANMTARFPAQAAGTSAPCLLISL
jgi:hypothetical protein